MSDLFRVKPGCEEKFMHDLHMARQTRLNAAMYARITMDMGIEKSYFHVTGPRRIRKKKLKRLFMRAAIATMMDNLEVVP